MMTECYAECRIYKLFILSVIVLSFMAEYYYKTLYYSNCCRVVINWRVCQC
jgi:hypothetical protein